MAIISTLIPNNGRRELALAYRRADLKRAPLLSGIVGSWLVALNQGSVILDGQFSGVFSCGFY
jgi:hypothetical protein